MRDIVQRCQGEGLGFCVMNLAICTGAVVAATVAQWLVGMPLELATTLVFFVGLAFGLRFPAFE